MRSRSRSFPLATAGALVAGALAATSVGAQTPAAPARPAAAGIDSSPAARGRAALVGRVHAPNDDAVPDAELTVLGDAARGQSADGRSARTGPGGAFRLDSIAPGRYFVRVRRLGFEPLYFAATLAGGTTRRIDVELTALPARLAAVDVRGRSGYNGFAEKRLRDFEFRRRAGFGRFYTRDDLKPYEGRTLADVLPYVAFGVSRRNLDAFSPFPLSSGFDCGRSGAYGGRGCGTRVSVNGMLPVPGELALDTPVSQIEALEVYGSVLVVWTGTEADD